MQMNRDRKFTVLKESSDKYDTYTLSNSLLEAGVFDPVTGLVEAAFLAPILFLQTQMVHPKIFIPIPPLVLCKMARLHRT